MPDLDLQGLYNGIPSNLKVNQSDRYFKHFAWKG